MARERGKAPKWRARQGNDVQEWSPYLLWSSTVVGWSWELTKDRPKRQAKTYEEGKRPRLWWCGRQEREEKRKQDDEETGLTSPS